MKTSQEKVCAEQFIKWYNQRHETNYEVVRATDYFPKIKNKVNWDFVACSLSDLEDGWLALELKALVDPEAKVQMIRWEQLVKPINTTLVGHLNGAFFVLGIPILPTLEQNKITKLRKALKKVLMNNKSTINQMKINDKIDLGLQIYELFPSWPVEPGIKIGPPPQIVYRVRSDASFTLYKYEETSFKIEIGISPPIMFEKISRVQKLTDALFDSVIEDLPKAVKQLKLAKEMGAYKTIWLLDLQTLMIDSEDIQQNLSARSSTSWSDIDEVYLVDVLKKTVAKVWP